jgi:hypothetical protein
VGEWTEGLFLTLIDAEEINQGLPACTLQAENISRVFPNLYNITVGIPFKFVYYS